ncbi:Glycoside hydrolase family 18 [Fusarium oxysporum f. sp. albedinis]|nr:Glycoside hydrolase family 18 [Fusarium oxysporum f. sp. albedinis]
MGCENQQKDSEGFVFKIVSTSHDFNVWAMSYFPAHHLVKRLNALTKHQTFSATIGLTSISIARIYIVAAQLGASVTHCVS